MAVLAAENVSYTYQSKYQKVQALKNVSWRDHRERKDAERNRQRAAPTRERDGDLPVFQPISHFEHTRKCDVPDANFKKADERGKNQS